MTQTLGSTIRAARLGYHWSQAHRCFIRVSGDGPFRFDLAPDGKIPESRVNEFRVWWEGDKKIIEEMALLKNVRAVHQPVTFFVDDDGALVDPPATGRKRR